MFVLNVCLELFSSDVYLPALRASSYREWRERARAREGGGDGGMEGEGGREKE